MNSIAEMFDLNGETAVITGGGGVLAGVMAATLARAGAQVAVWGRGRSAPIAEVVEELGEETGLSGRFIGVTVDTGEKQAVRKALEETEEKAGLPSILINGVGGNMGKTAFTEADLDTFRKVLDMNILAGLVVPTQVFTARWIEAGTRGTVINMASMASYTPLSGVWAYGASKAAVMNLTAATAKEFAPYGIRVNGIAPGFFIGRQNKALLIADEEKGTLTPRGQQVIDRTPFGRFGQQEDLAGVTVFLASEQASGFITGVTIPVDGGFLVDNI
jgi:NAD(P)-dependent dehydrogenase (short-subunit alcohol dehydrogenase family)